MTKITTTTKAAAPIHRWLLCAVVLLGLGITNVSAQTLSTYTFAQTSGTYAQDGVGASLTTTGTYDDNNFTAVTLPFTFTYAGTAFTTIGVSANGYCKLGALTTTSYAAPGAVTNSLAVFNADLDGSVANGGNLNYATTGATGSRVFTMQWTKWGFFSAATAAQSFQLKLYETSNTVQFCYQPNTPVTGTVHVGLTGATTGDVNVRTTTTNWTASTAGTSSSTCTYSSTVFPANGLVYTWTSAATVAAMAFTQVVGTYVPVEAAVSGTVLTNNTSSYDDSNFGLQTMPFSFTYHGASYTTVSVQQNGIAQLGATTASGYSSICSSPDVLSPLNADLYSLASTAGREASVYVVGVSPNRTYVIEWENWGFFSGGLNEISMQIRLKETANTVQFVYGPAPGANSRTAYVGITGATTADFQGRTTTTNWAATTASGSACTSTTVSSSVRPVNGLTFTWSPPTSTPCAGTPAPGATNTSLNPVCSGVNFTLSTANAFTGISGLTFNWQSSPDGITYTNTGINTATYTHSQTIPTYYRCIVTCANGGASGISTPIQVMMNTFISCYCTPTSTNLLTNMGVANFSTTGAITNITNNGTATGIAYTNYYPTFTASQIQGQSVNISVSSTTTYSQGFAIWIDYNQDGVFAAGEMVWNSGTTGTGTFTGSFTVPVTATVGTTKMRVRSNYAALPTDPCAVESYGEGEDYGFTVLAPAAPTIASFTPSSGCGGSTSVVITGANFYSISGVSFGGTPALSYVVNSTTQITAVPNANTTGVISIANTYGTGSSVGTFTINTTPSAPTVDAASWTISPGGTQTLTITDVGPNFAWYNAATGGTLLSSSATYTTPSLCTSATYYAEQNNGTCVSSARTAVTVNVPLINAITASPSNGLICAAGGSVTISLASVPGATYSWVPATGLDNTNTNSVVASPSTTTSYTATISSNGCNFSPSFNVGVLPGSAAVPSATPAFACYPTTTQSVLNSNLSAGNFGVSSIPYNLLTPPATGVTALVTNGVATVAQASGSMDDGGWSSIPLGFTYNFFGTNFTSVNVGTNGLLQFGAYNSTQIAQFSGFAAFPSTSNPANIMAWLANDLQCASNTSASIKYWTEGIAPTRRFVIQFKNIAQYGTTNSNNGEILLYETTGVVEIHLGTCASTNVKYTAVQNAGTIGAAAPGRNGFSTTITTPEGWRFTPPASYTYAWSAADAFTSANSSLSATNTSTTTATVTAGGTFNYNLTTTNPLTNCANSSVLTFGINNVPGAPTATGATINAGQTAALTASGVTGATFNWYNAATGGTLMGTGATFTTPSLCSNTSYWVDQTSGICLGTGRTQVDVVVNPLPAPSTTPSVQCGANIPSASVASSVPTSGAMFNWYNASTGGNLIQTPPFGSLQTIYTNDFSTGANGALVTGVASIGGGALTLYPNAGSQEGAIAIAASGLNGNQYNVQFDVTTSGTAGNMADGFSYSFGDDVATTAAYGMEQGTGSKLRISFDAFGNQGIYLVYGETVNAGYAQSVGGTVYAYSGNTTWLNSTNHVTISVNTSGQLTLMLGATTIFNNVQLPAAALTANRAAWRHVIGGRTGGSSMSTVIDNLAIQQSEPSAGSVTYLSSINTPTHFFVTEVIGGCESPRTDVFADVTPAPAITALTSAATVCPGTSFTLSQNDYTMLTSTWSASPAAGSGLTSSATNNNANSSLSVTPTSLGNYTYTLLANDGTCGYQASVSVNVLAAPVVTNVTATPATICSGYTTSLSAQTLSSGPQALPTGYGTSSATSTADDEILGVVVGSAGNQINNIAGCGATGAGAINGLSASVANMYENYTNLPAPSFAIGTTVPFTVTIGYCNGNAYGTIFGIYLDLNRNGAFESNELMYTSTYGTQAVAGTPISGTFTIPSTATAGLTLMRIVDDESSVLPGATGTYTWGETEDYAVNIIGLGPGTLTWSWQPGSLSGATATATVTASTTYTVSGNNGACASTGTVSVTTVAPAVAPTAVGAATACGTGTVTLTATGTGGTLNWYRVATGGNVIASGASFTTPLINADSTYYVAENNGTCDGVRTSVVATYTPPPAGVTVSGSNLQLCLPTTNNAILSATSAYSGYSFTWSPAPVSTSTTVYTNDGAIAHPSSTTTYTVTGTDGTCIAQATITVQAGNYPTLNSVTGNLPTICSGTTSQLVAFATAGGGSSTTPTYCTPAPTYCSSYASYGNYLSQVSLNGTPNMVNNTGHTSSSTQCYTNYAPGSLGTTTTTIAAGGSYSVGFQCAQTDANMVSAWIDFNNNGTFESSEMIATGVSLATANTTYGATFTVPFTATGGAHVMRVILNYSSNPTNPCNSNSSLTWADVEDYQISIQTGTGLNYAWSPSSNLSSSTIYNPVATPPVTATYSVTITDPSSGCAVTGSTTVNVNPTPSTPTISAAATSVCGAATTALTTTTPQAGNSIKWYNAATGGTLLYTGDVFTTPIATGNATYYAAEESATCASTRSSQTISWTPAPTVTVSSPTTLCSVAPVTLSASSSNDPNYTYTWTESGVNTLATTTGSSVVATVATATVVASTTYTVTGSDPTTGCASSATTNVTLYNFPAVNAHATPTAICTGSTSQITSGLSAANFSVTSIPFAPLTAPGNATVLANAGVATPALTSGSLDDGYWSNIPIGFNYNYFGTVYNTVQIGTNGVIEVGNGTMSTQFTFSNFPSSANPCNVVAVMAQDLYLYTSGTVRYWSTGTAPLRKFVVEYFDVPGFTTAGNITVQAIFSETVGTVEIHVTSVADATHNKTIGLQNCAGTIGASAPGRNNSNFTISTPEAWKFTPPGSYVFNWSPSTTLSSATIENPVATPTATTSYIVSILDNLTGCSKLDTAAVVVETIPTSPSVVGGTNCGPGVVNLSAALNAADPAYYTLRWYDASTGGTLVNTGTTYSPSISSTTTYYVEAFNGACATPTRVPVTATIFYAVSTISVPTSTPVCSTYGTTITADATAGADAITYSWSPATYLTSTSGATVTASSVTSPIDYTVTATSSNNCTNTAITSLTIDALPVGSYSGSTAICDNS
ncbi:MAG: GEVED domain-containing protein, partial [Bacteroidota bacterium]